LRKKKKTLQKKLLLRLNKRIMVTKTFSLRAPFKGVSFLFLLSFLSLFWFNLYAEKLVVDKEDFVSSFLSEADILGSYDQKVTAAEADHEKVMSMFFPKIKITFGGAPFPNYTYRKESIDFERSADGSLKLDENGGIAGIVKEESYWDKNYEPAKWGVALQAKISGEMPLYTFGRIDAASDAAKSGMKVAEASKEVAKLKLRKEAASLYYRYVMALEMKDVMDIAVEKVNEAEKAIKKMLYDEVEGVSQKDYIKLKIQKEKILYTYKKLLSDISVLQSVFKKVLGENWEIKDTYIKKTGFAYSYEDLEKFLIEKSAYASIMKNGLNAYKSLYKLEQSSLYPVLGLTGYYEYKHTSSVDEKDYPFTNSPYNGHNGEVGVGFYFNLNFLEQMSKKKKARAEWRAMQLKVKFVKKTTLLGLKRKYSNLQALDEQIGHVKRARKYAKGWMTMEFMNYKSDLGEVKNLIDAIKAFIENEYLMISSVYDYNMKVEDIVSFVGLKGE